MVQPFPTHFDPKGNTLSKLDRAFISCPSSLTLKLNIQCSVVGKPEECFANFESDHAPLALCFGRPLRLKIGELPIPRWICKHPNFKYHFNLLIDSVCILDLEVSQQLYIYKKCIREAAKRVRGDCLFLDPQGAFSNKLVLSSVSRALWFNDLALATRIIRHAPIAAELIFIDRGSVCAFSFENLKTSLPIFSAFTTELKWDACSRTLPLPLLSLSRSKSNPGFSVQGECKEYFGLRDDDYD